MKLLLALAIIGYSCWLVSDLIELLTGNYGAAVVYLTALFHGVTGVGIWGLFLAVPARQRRLLGVCSAMISVGHLGLAPLPLHVFWSGQSLMFVLGAHPIYIVLLLIWSLGILIFSVLLLRSARYPVIAAWLMLIGFTAIILSRPLSFPTPLINVITILLSTVMLWLCVSSLRTIRRPVP
jgi:hypothetical protein